jgi:hypothetical protein
VYPEIEHDFTDFIKNAGGCVALWEENHETVHIRRAVYLRGTVYLRRA